MHEDIEKLKSDLNNGTKLSLILKRLLSFKEFIEEKDLKWIENELNGYEFNGDLTLREINKLLPKYRLRRGILYNSPAPFRDMATGTIGVTDPIGPLDDVGIRNSIDDLEIRKRGLIITYHNPNFHNKALLVLQPEIDAIIRNVEKEVRRIIDVTRPKLKKTTQRIYGQIQKKKSWQENIILYIFISVIIGLLTLFIWNKISNNNSPLIDATLVGNDNTQIVIIGENNQIVTSDGKNDVKPYVIKNFEVNLATNDIWNIATDYQLEELCSQPKYICEFGPDKPNPITYWSEELKAYTGNFYFKEFSFNLGNKQYIENLDMQIKCDNNKLFGVRFLSEITEDIYLDEEAVYAKIKKIYPEQIVKFHLFWKSQIDSCLIRFLHDGVVLQEINIKVKPISLV